MAKLKTHSKQTRGEASLPTLTVSEQKPWKLIILQVKEKGTYGCMAHRLGDLQEEEHFVLFKRFSLFIEGAATALTAEALDDSGTVLEMEEFKFHKVNKTIMQRGPDFLSHLTRVSMEYIVDNYVEEKDDRIMNIEGEKWRDEL